MGIWISEPRQDSRILYVGGGFLDQGDDERLAIRTYCAEAKKSFVEALEKGGEVQWS